MASAVYLPGAAGPTIADETVALVREAMGDARHHNGERFGGLRIGDAC